MSLSIPQASQQGLFKQGYNSYDAEDGAVIRNVSVLACPSLNRNTDLYSRSMPAEQSHKPFRPPSVHMAEIRSSSITLQR
jgi:hypothetical protein